MVQAEASHDEKGTRDRDVRCCLGDACIRTDGLDAAVGLHTQAA